MRRGRVLGPLAAGLVLVGVLSGCSDLGGTGDLNYVAGMGNVVQIDPDDRGEPVDVGGTTLDGDEVELASSRGEVVVVPIWGNWCAPCHAEAPSLIEAAEQLDATFVGIDSRDSSRETGLSFQNQYDLPYPSIFDDGDVLLGFGNKAPSGAPGTIVLDRQGRVAAFINGAVTSTTTLVEVVEEVAAEDG